MIHGALGHETINPNYFVQRGPGRAWMVASSSNGLPALAVTYNHRSEAMYRAISREPGNAYVKRSLNTGLENVRMLSHRTPTSIREVLCAMHNAYHDGTAETWFSLLDISEEVMLQWDQRASSNGLQTRSAQYDQFHERFVFKDKQSMTMPFGGSLNYFRITNVVNNYFNKFEVKNSIRDWCNKNMNFSDFKLNNRCWCWFCFNTLISFPVLPLMLFLHRYHATVCRSSFLSAYRNHKKTHERHMS